MSFDVLVHHGVLGMKWGIRRYQNKDGTLTDAGKERYHKIYDEQGYLTEKGRKEYNRDIKNLKKWDDGRALLNRRTNAYKDLRLMPNAFLSMVFEPVLLAQQYTEALLEKRAIRVGEKKASKILYKYGDTDLGTYSDEEADLVVKYMLSKQDQERKRNGR